MSKPMQILAPLCAMLLLLATLSAAQHEAQHFTDPVSGHVHSHDNGAAIAATNDHDEHHNDEGSAECEMCLLSHALSNGVLTTHHILAPVTPQSQRVFGNNETHLMAYAVNPYQARAPPVRLS